MTGGARQLVLGEDDLLLPGVELIDRIGGGFPVGPVAALDGLSAAAPRGKALGVGDLPFHVEPANEEVVAGVLQVLKN